MQFCTVQYNSSYKHGGLRILVLLFICFHGLEQLDVFVDRVYACKDLQEECNSQRSNKK